MYKPPCRGNFMILSPPNAPHLKYVGHFFGKVNFGMTQNFED